jgi:hypothetical protein
MILVAAGMVMASAQAAGAATHVHFFVDAAGGKLTFVPSSGGFDAQGNYSSPFAATGVADAYLPGIAVSFPTITTLENFDGEQSLDLVGHDVGVRLVKIAAVSGSPTTTFSWLITKQDREFAGQNTGNANDQLAKAALVANGSGGTTPTISGFIDMGPLSEGVATGNHWHGQHMTFSDAGVYDVTFQLFDLNAVNGLGASNGVFGDSALYTVRFVATPEPATAIVVMAGVCGGLLRRRRRQA